MKKSIITVLLMAMLLSLFGCGAQSPEVNTEATPAPTAEPTPTPIPEPTPSPEPEWAPGVVRVDYGLLAKTLDRGAELTVVGQWEDYYVVSEDEGELLIESRFVQLSTEAFENRQGYTNYNSPVYHTAYLVGEAICYLGLNTVVQVLGGKDDWRYVEWDGGSGYMPAENVLDAPVYYYYGGGGGGGGADGGDIQLSAKFPSLQLEKLASDAEYSPMEPTKAVVASDGIEVYEIVFRRGDELKVVEANADTCRLLLGDSLREVPRWLVRTVEDSAYESWEGFSEYLAVVYKDMAMQRKVVELERNNTVLVLDELENCYLVEVNGEIAYMAFEHVSREQVPVPYYYYGGGGGGGGDWTPPAL